MPEQQRPDEHEELSSTDARQGEILRGDSPPRIALFVGGGAAIVALAVILAFFVF